MKADWWQRILLTVVVIVVGVLAWRALDLWQAQQRVTLARARVDACLHQLEVLRPSSDFGWRVFLGAGDLPWQAGQYARTWRECEGCRRDLER